MARIDRLARAGVAPGVARVRLDLGSGRAREERAFMRRSWASLTVGGLVVVIAVASYLLLRMVGVAEAWPWVQLLLWAAVAVFTVQWIVAVPARYVKARWALHRALDSGLVDDFVLHVIDASHPETARRSRNDGQRDQTP